VAGRGENMKNLKHIGEGYYGFEPDGATVSVSVGQTVEVSDAKAEQLLSDFPNEWETIKEIVAEEEEKAPKVRGKK